MRVSDDILARVAAWPEDQEGFAGNFERDMARELIAARVIVEARRASCACHKKPCACMFCKQLRAYDEAIK